MVNIYVRHKLAFTIMLIKPNIKKYSHSLMTLHFDSFARVSNTCQLVEIQVRACYFIANKISIK